MSTSLILSLLISLAVCFFGLKLNKLLIAVIAIGAGFSIGEDIGMNLFNNETIALITAIALALVLAGLSFKLYLVGVFLICFCLGFITCYTLIDTESLKVIIGIVIGIILGVLAINFTSPMIIFTTSLSGSILFSETINQMFLLPNNLIMWAIMIIMFILGLKVQFTNEKAS